MCSPGHNLKKHTAQRSGGWAQTGAVRGTSAAGALKIRVISIQVLNERLRMGGPGGASYYSFSPHAAWRIVVMDGYDVSLLGWPEEHPLHQQARRILAERNPNKASPILLIAVL